MHENDRDKRTACGNSTNIYYLFNSCHARVVAKVVARGKDGKGFYYFEHWTSIEIVLVFRTLVTSNCLVFICLYSYLAWMERCRVTYFEPHLAYAPSGADNANGQGFIKANLSIVANTLLVWLTSSFTVTS